MVGFNEEQREELIEIRGQIWDYYQELKEYKEKPDAPRVVELEQKFDDIFLRETRYEILKEELRKIHKKKKELLLVLKRPDIPLHNNMGEQNIREYVKKMIEFLVKKVFPI